MGHPHLLLLPVWLWLSLMTCWKYLPPGRHIYLLALCFWSQGADTSIPGSNSLHGEISLAFVKECLNVSTVCPLVFRSSLCPFFENCISWLPCLLNSIWIQPVRGTTRTVEGRMKKINQNIPTPSSMPQVVFRVTTAPSPWFQPLL